MKKISLSIIHFIYFYFFAVLAFTYILPENILDISITLRKIVDFIALIFPGIAKFGKYAAFPQVAQLVYSICIVTLPATVILAYQALRNDINKDSNVMKIRLENLPAYSVFIFWV
jgi:hypothetical protein